MGHTGLLQFYFAVPAGLASYGYPMFRRVDTVGEVPELLFWDLRCCQNLHQFIAQDVGNATNPDIRAHVLVKDNPEWELRELQIEFDLFELRLTSSKEHLREPEPGSGQKQIPSNHLVVASDRKVIAPRG